MNAFLFLRLAAVGLALGIEPTGPGEPGIASPPSPDRFVSGQVTRDARRDQVEALLDSKIDLKYHEMPLLDVLAGIHAKTGLTLSPESRLIEQDRTNAMQTLVTIDAQGITVRSLLRSILRECNLAYFYRDESVVITTDAIAWTALETRVYPIGDLVASSDGIPSHGREIRTVDGRGFVEPNTDVDELVDVITSTITPQNWSDAGGTASIKFLPVALALTITQRCEALDEIEALLKKLRDVRKSQLAMFARPKPDKLQVVSYAMPRHAPTWPNASALLAANQMNADRYEAELKTSLDHAARTAKEFANVIPQVIAPESWKSAGGDGEGFVVADRLVIRQTAAVHEQVAKLLRDNSPPQSRPQSQTPSSGGGGSF